MPRNPFAVNFGVGGMPQENPWDFQFPMNPPNPNIYRPENQPNPLQRGYLDILNEMQGAEQGPASKAFGEHIKAQPTRETVRPRWIDRFAAALAGVSEGWQKGGGAGVQAAQNTLEMPLQRAREDWEIKGRGLGFEAQQEQEMMQRKINFIKTLNEMQNKAEELRLRGEEVEARKLESLARQRYYDFQTTGKITFENVDGQVVGVNPRGEKVSVLGKTEGALNRSQDWDIFQIGEANENSRTNKTLDAAAARQRAGFAHDKEMVPIEGKQQQDTHAANVQTDIQAGLHDKDVATAEQDAAIQQAIPSVIGKHPEWDGFVKRIPKKGQKNIVERYEGQGDPADPNYQAFWTAVKAEAKAIVERTRRPGGTSPTPVAQPTGKTSGTSSTVENVPSVNDFPPAKRVKDQVYRMADGVSLGKWNGTYFTPVTR